MIDWLDSHVVYWHWLVFGIVLAAVEMFIPSFFMLWLGAAAVVVGLVLLFLPLSFAVQMLVWGILSVLCLVVWFRMVAPRMKDVSRSGMAKEALLGKVGTVLEYQEASSRGRLRFPAPLLGEDEWRFICEEKLNPGDKVSVLDTSGNHLIVKLAS